MWFRLAGGTLTRILRGAIDLSQIGGGAGLAGEAAEMGFEMALDMCGNLGQVSVIEQTGFDAFYQGAMNVVEGGESSSALYAACPYPDAVGEILDEVSMEMDDYIQNALGGLSGTGAQVINELW